MPESPPKEGLKLFGFLHDILSTVAEEKPRIFQGGKDMTMSLALITLIVVLAVWPTGMCTFSKGMPENGPVHEVDAHSFLSLEARGMNFPVREPALPEGWIPNSARRTAIAGTPAPTMGVVTPDGGYLQLMQTDVALDEAVKGVDAHVRKETSRQSIAGGHEAIRYTSEERDVRDLWAIDLGDVRLLISGAATPEEFRTFMDAAVNAQPLPHSD